MCLGSDQSSWSRLDRTRRVTLTHLHGQIVQLNWFVQTRTTHAWRKYPKKTKHKMKFNLSADFISIQSIVLLVSVQDLLTFIIVMFNMLHLHTPNISSRVNWNYRFVHTPSHKGLRKWSHRCHTLAWIQTCKNSCVILDYYLGCQIRVSRTTVLLCASSYGQQSIPRWRQLQIQISFFRLFFLYVSVLKCWLLIYLNYLYTTRKGFNDTHIAQFINRSIVCYLIFMFTSIFPWELVNKTEIAQKWMTE